MKWCNHRLVTATLIFGVTGHMLPVYAALKGSTYPDRVEGNMNDPDWGNKHRTHSHFWLYYVVFIYCLYLYFNGYLLYLPVEQVKEAVFTLDGQFFARFILYYLLWYAVGAVCHIFEDMFSGYGVPIFAPKRRHGIRLFKVGSPVEYFVANSLAVLFVLSRWLLGNGEVFLF